MAEHEVGDLVAQTTVKTVWDRLWDREKSATQEDAMSLFLARLIREAFIQVRGKSPTSAIEIGAGSGRASRYLNQMGCMIGILDVSEEALHIARKCNADVLGARFYHLDFFRINENTVRETYEIAWNAGVIEHFHGEEQRDVFRRMSGVITDDGLVILLTPYRGSFLYRLGKWILEQLNSFPYGYEDPVWAIRPILPEEMEIVGKERSSGFLILFFRAFKALSQIAPLRGPALAIDRLLNRLTVGLMERDRWNLIFKIDRWLSSWFGGYLLLSICQSKRRKSEGGIFSSRMN